MELTEMKNKMTDLTKEIADISSKIDEILVDDSVDAKESGLQELVDKKKSLNEKYDTFKVMREDAEKKEVADNFKKDKEIINGGETIKVKDEKAVQTKALNEYLHSKGNIKDEAMHVTTQEAEPVIPKEIVYNPKSEVDTVADLLSLVTRTPVSTGYGEYPILKRATSTFPTVEELKENPALAEPEFNSVSWKVVTRRGAIPLSEEAIADSQVDLMGMVGNSINEIRVNTTNQDISNKLKSFTAKNATQSEMLDTIKHILNVDLDVAYNKVIIASQSFYNALDTLKDKNGQYIFHQDTTSTTGSTLLGVKVIPVNDELLGLSGEKHAFIGDLARGILYADRQQSSISWQDDKVYGRYLRAAIRYDVEVADSKAGYFLTVNDDASK